MRVHETAAGPQRCKQPHSWLGDLPIPLDFAPMEARLVDELPQGREWQFEPKWDGFRCVAFRDGGLVELRAKSGKPLSRYFPEVVAALRELPVEHFVIDGELAIPCGDELTFDSLQLRLHPAESRIRKLSQELPAILILFDCLVTGEGESVVERPLMERRAALEILFDQFASPESLRLSPYSRQRAEALQWLQRADGSLDGVIAKPLYGPYVFGERAMLKVKRMRTADCVVGGFRYGTDSDEVGSLLLGLYNERGKLDHVGFTSAIAQSARAELTSRLEALIEPPGFTGNAPGGPSRWNNDRSTEWQPLRNDLVVEVCYDHVSNGRFRHGTRLLRWRPDKAPWQCTYEQIQRSKPSERNREPAPIAPPAKKPKRKRA